MRYTKQEIQIYTVATSAWALSCSTSLHPRPCGLFSVCNAMSASVTGENFPTILIIISLTLRACGNVFERFHLCFHAKTDANTNNLLQKLELIQYIENIFPWSV